MDPIIPKVTKSAPHNLKAQIAGLNSASISELIAACDALRDPCCHNNYSQASALVSSIEQSAQGVGYSDLQFAASQTRKELDRWKEHLPEYQYAVNLFDRAEWIYHELLAAVGDKDGEKILDGYRFDFSTGRSGMYQINIREWQLAKKRLGVGYFRRTAREMSCQVSDLIRTLPEVPVEEISTFVRQKCAELDRKYLDFADDLRFAESRVKVSSTLTPYINEVANQLGIIRFLAGGLSRLNPHEGESQTYYTQLVRQLPAVADSLNTLEVEARVIFAEALGSSVPESAHRLVRISEHTGSPSESLLQSVQGMMREWVIDPSLKRPQYGFGRVHTLKELRDYLVTYKGRLFQVQAEGRDVGYYILFSDLQDFPPEVKEIIEAVGRTGEYLKVKQGWTQLVGVTKAGRDWAKRNGVDLYTIIHEAVVDTFSSFQVEKAFCIVRDGEFANLALDSHLNPKRGWRRTGATVQLGQFPYQILRFDVSPGGTN